MTTTHDHQITIGSTTTNLRLARDDKGKAMYTVTEDVPEYNQQLEVGQKDWTGGHGQYKLENANMYFDGQSIDTTQEGRIILGPLITEVYESDGSAMDTTTVVCFLWCATAGKLICATPSNIYVYGTTWTVATPAVAGVLDLKEYNGVIYAATGATSKYYTSTTGAAWTITDLTDGTAYKFLVAPNAAGTSNVLWKVNATNELKSTTNGQAGGTQWSSAALIGDTSSAITTPFLLNDELMVGRQDNLYNYDNAGGIHALMDELRHARDTQNFKYVINWQSGAYFSIGTGIGELIGSSPGVFSKVGPLTETGDISKVGTCVGLSSDADWIYAAMDEGTNTVIYKGRPTAGGKWQWCPWVFISTNAIATIYVAQHSSTSRRLWFGYGTHTGYVTITDNPTTDSAATFAPSGFVRMSYIYGTNPYWDKMYQTIVTETVGCTANITVQPMYRQDTTSAMANLTSAITTNGVVATSLTTSLSTKRVQFELDLATNNSAITPQVLTFIAKGVEKPETVRVHECTYLIGTRLTERTRTMRTTLRGARTATTLIRFSDLRYYPAGTGGTAGTDYVYVIMQPGYPKEVEIVHENGRDPELGIQCRWQEIPATGVITETTIALSLQVTAIEFVIDGNGSAISTGQKGHVYVPFGGTITQASMVADQAGTMVVDIWKDITANFPPTDADTITASAPLTLTATNITTDTTLTGWTTTVATGDYLAYNVDSCATITRVTVALKITRT